MILQVTNVEYIGDYSLICTFNNGERRKVDLTPLLEYPAYEELKDKSKFEQFGLDETIFGQMVRTSPLNICLKTACLIKWH